MTQEDKIAPWNETTEFRIDGVKVTREEYIRALNGPPENMRMLSDTTVERRKPPEKKP